MTVKNEGLVQTISRFIEGGLMLLGFEILRLRQGCKTCKVWEQWIWHFLSGLQTKKPGETFGLSLPKKEKTKTIITIIVFGKILQKLCLKHQTTIHEIFRFISFKIALKQSCFYSKDQHFRELLNQSH